jgi:superfamily II DNA or RNA helicase
VAIITSGYPTRFRYTGNADPSAPGGMAEIYRALVADQDRLDQIVTDVLTAHRNGANILVLTTWVDHLNAITSRLSDSGCDVTVLRGGMKARERLQTTERLAAYGLTSRPC